MVLTEMCVVKLWLLPMGSLIVGVLIGALAFAAAERHVRSSSVADVYAPAGRTGVSLPTITPAPGVTSAGDAGKIAGPAGSEEADRWAKVEDDLVTLRQRIAVMEERISALSAVSQEAVDGDSQTVDNRELNQETMIAAGVDPGVASEFMRRQSQLEMQRLELRDTASREGWVDSERFLAELRELDGDVGVLREEIGDDAYDRFLYLNGQPNRITVASVIDESPAQMAGMQAGDVVLGYADSRVFSYADLRNATRAGERSEYVVMRVQRQGETLELSVPRGPLGIRMDSDRLDPDAASQFIPLD